jgi:hypothetical protein
MTTATGSNGMRQASASRITHFNDMFEDWMLQLVLVAGVVAAMIQGVLSLSP